MVLETTSKTYGDLNSDKLAEEIFVCRQIVNEISNFGVNDRQIINIIHLLTLQIENVDVMQELSAAVKEIAPFAFITKSFEKE